jgi:hypothetical protein
MKPATAGINHLTRLPTLQHVSLRASQLTNEALRHLAAIKPLTRIDLHGTGEPGVNAGTCFTIAGVQRLKVLPNLRTLWLTNVDFAGGFLDFSLLESAIGSYGQLVSNAPFPGP